MTDDGAWSFQDLGERVVALSARLRLRGVGMGTRVALVASNRAETVVAILALIELGSVLVPIHPRYTAREAEAIRADVAPCVTLEDADLKSEGFGAVEFVSDEVASSEPLAIVHTSGTSGSPKGAVLSRGAFLESAEACWKHLGVHDDDRWLLCMPVCHVGGLSILTRCLVAQRPVVLVGRFDPRAVLSAIERHRVTLLSVVPTMLRSLLDADDRGVLAALRVVLVGGAACPDAWIDECASRGIAAVATYGLTEACSMVTAHAVGDSARASQRGAGRPLSSVEMRIVGEAGVIEKSLKIGRIQLRGPSLLSGYHGRPDPFVDGWFDTGDLGCLDEGGVLFVSARRSDLIVTGGENVYPAEVERALEALVGVREALVFAVPSETWGAVVGAAIVADAETQIDLSAIALAAAQVLSSHKRPRYVAVVDALPLTPAGKLDRRGAFDRLGVSLRPMAYSRDG
jgi:O-succinylbenzoic acid--CoA ligase